LNNAYWHPLSRGAVAAIQGYLERKATGSSHFSFTPASDEVKARLAQLIRAKPNEISFVSSTTVGENLVVAALDFPLAVRL
jgi:selenocysteine lyase/cysteine desulfurase